MYIDYNWVKQYLKEAPTLAEAARLINSTGLETEIAGDGLEIEHTVNRPDAMCHYGMARELAVKAGLEMVEPPIFEGEIPELTSFEISSESELECPQYNALLIENVKAGPSPDWLRKQLESIDQTSHNVLVDLTNFLLWEFSQPTHAFDADKLTGEKIHVRLGREGERLTTLDGRDHAVDGLLCITDASGPIALGGVMGGEPTEVDGNTTRLLLELAAFRGATCRRTGRKTNIHSDARHRYERGVDRENMERVIRRFIYLLQQEQPEVRVVGLRNMNLVPFERPEIQLRREKLDLLLGIRLSDDEVMDLLQRMDFRPEVNPAGWRVASPGYKVDVTREVDVIEELIRFAGIDRLESTLPNLGGSDYNPTPLLRQQHNIREALRTIGLQEAITYGFISEEWDAAMGEGEAMRLRNPMSNKQAVMRRHILPGLLESVRGNTSRGQLDLGLFELGHTFTTTAQLEPIHLAVALSQGKDQNHWWGDTQGHPFYRVKGVFEALREQLNWPELQLTPKNLPCWLKPGEALAVYHGDTCIGGFGILADALARQWDLDVSLAVMELDLSFLGAVIQPELRSSQLSTFPSMKIDMAFVVDKALPFAKLYGHLNALELDNLEALELFDAYEGKAVGKDQKSLGFRFRFRAPERTLTSEEVSATMEKVVASVKEQFGATLRT